MMEATSVFEILKRVQLTNFKRFENHSNTKHDYIRVIFPSYTLIFLHCLASPIRRSCISSNRIAGLPESLWFIWQNLSRILNRSLSGTKRNLERVFLNLTIKPHIFLSNFAAMFVVPALVRRHLALYLVMKGLSCLFSSLGHCMKR